MVIELPKHKSKIVTEWLHENVKKVLSYPLQINDLNASPNGEMEENVDLEE